jgi:hypothetical protein
MLSRARELALPTAIALVLAGLLAWVGLLTMAFTDYEAEAEPALQLLRDGDVTGFLRSLPAYGGSLIMRSPFALAPDLWGGGDLALFRSMALPCLVATVVLAVMLWRRSLALQAARGPALLVVVLCAGNPIALRALEIGHPEELLGAVLCVGAVLAAGASRPVVAGALVGLAIANKPWAVLALAPVLIVLGERRMVALSVGGLVAAAFVAPLLLVESSAVGAMGTSAQDSGDIFQPWQVWWYFGSHDGVVMGAFTEKVGYRAAPSWIGEIARPLVIVVPLAVCGLLARRVRARPWHDGLLLLALVLLLRCLLDPWNVVYYELPFLLALLAWEVHARRGWPLISVVATLLSWVTLEQLPYVLSPDLQAAAYLAWSVPLAAALVLRLSGRSLPAPGPRLLGSVAQWSYAAPSSSSRLS